MSSGQKNKKQVQSWDDNDLFFFEKLFKQYYRPLIRFAYRYVNNEKVAEDIIHDVFLYLWSMRERLDFGANIKTYMYTSVRNRCLNYLQKQNVENKYKDLNIVREKETQNPETIMMNKELEASIKNAINAMPEKRREIFIMNRIDGLTYSEIASVLNISIKTVETQMTRALKFLRKKLSPFFLPLL